LKGHDFSRAVSAAKSTWALQAAEKLDPVKGTGFSPYITSLKSTRALAPEGRLSHLMSKFSPSSAACSTLHFLQLPVPPALRRKRFGKQFPPLPEIESPNAPLSVESMFLIWL
jgi:hypothetical protein